jgi:hypothetical protein
VVLVAVRMVHHRQQVVVSMERMEEEVVVEVVVEQISVHQTVAMVAMELS